MDHITLLRKANDMAASATFPEALISNGFVLQDAAGESYLTKGTANANKIILFLHSWSADYTQVQEVVFSYLQSIERAIIVSPNFNGPNNTPGALSSDDAINRIALVLQEIQYKTGLERIYIFSLSGGTITALNFIAKFPEKIHRASLWFPIYDLQMLYNTTADESLKSDMISVFGHAPNGSIDSSYLGRSPKGNLNAISGPVTIFINTGTYDTTSIKSHGEMARDHIQRTAPDCAVIYNEWPIGHVFTENECLSAIKQLILE